MFKKITISILSIMLMVTITGCTNEPLSCAPGFVEDGGKCIEDPVVTCKGRDDTYPPEEERNYELVWSDEFNGDSLDTSIWKYETGGSGWGNNELQNYTSRPDNAEVIDGNLVITAKTEEFGGSDYTSARLVTRDNATFKYGKFEIRAKLPSTLGTWSAIWMMPQSSRYGAWPNSGEIDIMEQVGYQPTVIHSTIHTKSYNHKDNTQKGSQRGVSSATTDFNIYEMEWLPDRIIFSVNGENTHFNFSVPAYNECPTFSNWPFDQQFYFVLNVAVGGDWGGANGVSSENEWEDTMMIDYIKVYQDAEIS